MKPWLIWAAAGVFLAIGITSTMDARGLSAFSALPLCPLMAALMLVLGLPWRGAGFRLGSAKYAALAFAYPVAVVTILAAGSYAAGAWNVQATNWTNVAINLAIQIVATFAIAIVTEEGFFRGWLWAVLGRGGLSWKTTLACTSIAFAAWHISSVTLAADYRPETNEIGTFLANAAVIGAVWGLMRVLSGSIVVTSLSHGVWNGLAYVFFGYGTNHGVLHVTNSFLYGPELGVFGLILNLTVAAVLLTLTSARLHSAGTAVV